MSLMSDIVQMDDEGRLFLSAAIADWSAVHALGIDVVIDLDGDVDQGVPTEANRVLYVYLPIDDGRLPDLARLHAVARMAADLVKSGNRVLAHCGLGLNRSALMIALILGYLGMDRRDAVERCRNRRPGALYNPVFAVYLMEGK
jgi:protein-tyrosine phosphatase